MAADEKVQKCREERESVLADVEAELIRRAMRLAKGNKTKAAELLGISRPRLHRRWEEMEGAGS